MLEEFITDPAKLRDLEPEEQLAILAELTLYCAAEKTRALRTANKTRVDSCIEAQEWYDREKYWIQKNQNVKQLYQGELIKMQRGL